MQTPVTPVSLWRLEPDTLTWSDQHAPPARMTRFIGNQAMLSLAVPDCIGIHPYIGINTDYCLTGPLYKTTDQQRTQLADKVIEIYTEPLN
ncbi:hypothetical protein ACQP2U_43590 (plasmid) [Nocardia sp. CA-084685]|uniref:hypothetical protein n=1 Tax=Nocardia sp. CA-084685 TaxID=3239970 RepID=UPI003D996DD4